ncbi:MAG TPA: hypothetical protein PK073_04825 [Ignavibacteriaceae bacterium]|nr:hypothetical protein [Ignavibacteriaceae bacterium]
MLLLGFLAFLQTVLLPGYVFINIFKVKTESNIQKWIYIFAFSLFVNYALVTILVTLGIYKFTSVVVIIVLEFLFIIYLLFKRKIKLNISIKFRNLILEYLSFLKSITTGGRVLFLISGVIVLFYVSLFFANIGTIFYFVDTVYHAHHWNTWSIDFSNNIFPIESSHFPQLIPTNWSISYLLINEPNVHFFPKSIMPLFFLCNLLLFLALGIEKKQYVYFFGLIIYGLFAPIIYSLGFIADGNADLPVSFFSFLAFYAYRKTDKAEFKLKEYLVVFLFASTAAGTKLAGFYVFFFLSLLCLYNLVKNFRRLTKKEIINLIVSVILILIINLFWYLVKPKVMASGLHQPEWLAEGYLNILKNALYLVYNNFGLPVVAFLIITIFFSLLTKEAKYITMVFVIPPVILWMFKYSADFRNLSFVVPFISYVSAFGVEKIYKILKNKRDSLVIEKEQSKVIIADKKNFLRITLCSIISLIFYLVAMSDSFYQFLYWIYSSTNKYYFHSNRIIYFTDFTFFVHVDVYQKVISTMFLLLSITGLLFLLKLRLRDVFTISIIGITILNFTLLTKQNILDCQRDQFDKVDARNYYQTLNTIVKSGGLDKTVFTNFESISNEKIPRNITFVFVGNKELVNILQDTSYVENTKLFIKRDVSENQLNNAITNSLLNDKSQNLFEDDEYIFLELN